jgi:tetratricopeptide (TPR) repeat protein
MKLAEFLLQGRQLRQQDRTSAIAYFEQCLQNIATDANSVEYMDTKARVLLDLALELIATQQTDQIQRAKVLVQQSRDILNQSLETSREQTAYLLYVRAILAMELGDLRDVLPTLQAAYEAYGNNKEGQALTDDAIGHYYIKISDYSSAIASFERSLSIRIESNDESAIGKSYAHLGQFYLLSGELNQANSLFQNSLDLAIHQSDNFLRLQALNGKMRSL